MLSFTRSRPRLHGLSQCGVLILYGCHAALPCPAQALLGEGAEGEEEEEEAEEEEINLHAAASDGECNRWRAMVRCASAAAGGPVSAVLR
jgi:hypothetical protein